ncbi:MAG: helix-hairpin-helix domain-containing protein [Legionella sp.]|jgi:competence protein ComEA
MKANCFALLVSLFVISLPIHAESSPKTESKAVTVIHKINLNKADLSQLTGSFKGIGKKRAEAIIAYRESHNGIKSIEEFAEIKGFGQHFVDANLDKLKQTFDF